MVDKLVRRLHQSYKSSLLCTGDIATELPMNIVRPRLQWVEVDWYKGLFTFRRRRFANRLTSSSPGNYISTTLRQQNLSRSCWQNVAQLAPLYIQQLIG